MNKAHIAVLALAMLLAVPAFAGRIGAGRMLLQGNGTDGNGTAALPANQTSAKISSEILNATQINIAESTVFAPNDATWLQIFKDGDYADFTEFLAANNQSQSLTNALQGLVVPGLYRTDVGVISTSPSTSLQTLNGGNLTVTSTGSGFTVTYPDGTEPYPIVKADFNQTSTDTLIHVVNASPSFLALNGGGNGTANGTRRFYF